MEKLPNVVTLAVGHFDLIVSARRCTVASLIWTSESFGLIQLTKSDISCESLRVSDTPYMMNMLTFR